MAMLFTLKYRLIHSYVVMICGTQEVVSQSQVIKVWNPKLFKDREFKIP